MRPFDPGYYDSGELTAMGFKVGENVLIARNCTIIGLANHSFENITIGDNVRIDGFTTIAAASGHLTIGSHVQVGGYGFFLCAGGITLDDFCAISQRVSIYSASDDYSGETLGNPRVPGEYRKAEVAPVHLCRYVLVGAHTMIMPGVTIEEGSAVGAMSQVPKSLAGWGIYVGNPARRANERSKALAEKAEAFLASRAATSPG